MAATTTTTEYLPPSLTFLIANFQSFVTEKLDSTNYFAWKTQIENALLANSLFEYANGTVTVPSVKIRDQNGNESPNPEYKRWETIDRMLMSCIIATISSSLLPHIVGSTHTCEVWSRLEEKFSSLSRTHIHDLKCRIYSLKKTSSMEQYVDSIKVLIQKLEATGTHMDDEELVFHTLKGLPNEQYRSFKQAIRTRFEISPLTFQGLATMLLAEELYLDTDPVDTTNILLAQHRVGTPSVPPHLSQLNSSVPPQQNQQVSYPPSFNGPLQPQMNSYSGNNYGGNRNNRNGNRFKPKSNYPPGFLFHEGACQICGRGNHQAYSCYYRQNLNYRPPQFSTHSQYTPNNGQGQQGQSGPGGQSGYGMGHFGQHGLPQGYNSQVTSQSQPQVYMVSSDYGNSSHGCSSYPPAQQASPSYNGFSTMPQPVDGHHTSAFQPTGVIYPSANSLPSAVSNSGVPWFFDSGASAHVTNSLNQISIPTTNAPTSVTVGNGQAVPVSHSGLSDQPSGSSGVLSSGVVSPSSFF